MKKIFLTVVLLVLPSPGWAQITVPYEFSANTTILSARVNANFDMFADALDRTGGTITGNIAVDANITVDGVDISDFLTATQVLTQVGGSAATPSYSVVGDLNTGMYFSGADALELATGGTKALGVDSTQFIDSPTQPRASAYNDATQSINDSTDTVLTFNQEDYDVGTMHDTGSNTSRITIPTGGDGLYLIIGGTTYAADADGYRELWLRKNGTTKMARVQAVNAGGSASVGLQVQQVLVLAATDYIELGVSHAAGAALNVGSATRSQASHLQLVKLW